ncbi:hypothetical protein F511_47472 [Dorcoceras hygrometricum]|uniref:Uncharacterized protein n=1 Tax=Dorcoceras hygrometricum TaxID=472368 RepID=A0A2Z6ZQY4_9LAMI|nr:hypothetical protein F511_47472 [Dorcoceras hygrometricum]
MADGVSSPVVRYCAVSRLDLDCWPRIARDEEAYWPRLVAQRGSALAARFSLAVAIGRGSLDAAGR